MREYYFIILLTTLFASCTKDHTKELIIVSQFCDTTTIKYAQVNTILQNNCGNCHLNGNIQGGVSLNTYEEVQNNITRILSSIKHENFSPMPQGSTKLAEDTIQVIQYWYDNGMCK